MPQKVGIGRRELKARKVIERQSKRFSAYLLWIMQLGWKKAE
jgi:hypothetical protein